MEPITALFGIACLGAGGGVGYWLKQNHEKMQKLNDFNIVLQKCENCKNVEKVKLIEITKKLGKHHID